MVNQPIQSPFTVGGMVTNPDLFVGRRDAVDYIIRNMVKDQPVTVNIVGDRKVGKSSLINHVVQSYEAKVASHGKNPQKFGVIYLSAQDLTPKYRSQFFQRVSEELSRKSWILNNVLLEQALHPQIWDENSFRLLLRTFKQEQILPVICLDDMEKLLEQDIEFSNDFFEYLRSLLDQRMLMMVIASRKKLFSYKRKYNKTSSFFNKVPICPVEDFSDEEAKDLVRLPTKEALILGEEKRQLAIEWGGRHPYRLQLAAESLFLAEKQKHGNDWAKRHFQQQLEKLDEMKSKLTDPIQLISRVGATPQMIGDFISKYSKYFAGLLVLLVPFLYITGFMDIDEVGYWIRKNIVEDVLRIDQDN